MNYRKFYAKLFAPFQRFAGQLDAETLMPIIGFDAGGPLSFCTIGYGTRRRFRIYVSCELAVRSEQKPASFGRYELLASSDNENWVRTVVSDIGRASMDLTFEHGHTLDIGAWVKPRARIQGVLFEKVYSVSINGESFGILRVIGITRRELNYKLKVGAEKLVTALKRSRVYPNTSINRASIV